MLANGCAFLFLAAGAYRQRSTPEANWSPCWQQELTSLPGLPTRLSRRPAAGPLCPLGLPWHTGISPAGQPVISQAGCFRERMNTPGGEVSRVYAFKQKIFRQFSALAGVSRLWLVLVSACG